MQSFFLSANVSLLVLLEMSVRGIRTRNLSPLPSTFTLPQPLSQPYISCSLVRNVWLVLLDLRSLICISREFGSTAENIVEYDTHTLVQFQAN